MDLFASLNTMTNGQLLFIGLLIFAAVLIFPRLIRRKNIQRRILEKTKKGEIIRPEDFAGKKQKLFFTHNAQPSEIEELLVKLKSYAFKHEMKIVFPGSFPYNGKTSTATMILVGKFGILLLHCYGFGGHIYLDESKRRFMQNMNDTIKEIPNPVRAMDQNMDLARLFLKGFDFSPVPVYSASVFTRQNVILSVPDDIHVFTRSDLMHWLETEECFGEDNGVPVRRLADHFTEAIKDAKK